MSEGEIGPDIYLLGMKSLPQDPDREIERTGLRKLHVERDHNYERDSYGFDKGKPLLQSLNLQRRIVWGQNLKGVRMKRQDRGSAANFFSPRNEISHELLMTKMDSVKISNRYNGRPILGNECIQAINYFHGCH